MPHKPSKAPGVGVLTNAQEKDIYNEAYSQLVNIYNATNNQDVLEWMEIAENAMAPSMTFFNWDSWLEHANKLLSKYSIPTQIEKEVWQMTNEEFRQRARVWKDLTPQEQQLAKKQYIKETGDEEGAKEYSPEFAMGKFFYDRLTGKVLGEDIETPEWYIKQARAEGKPIPPEVMKDYPSLIPKKSKRRPPATQNIQSVSFNSELFDCYGKQTKRGFRAYCRRK